MAFRRRRGLEPTVDQRGVTKWRIRICDPHTHRRIRIPGTFTSIEAAERRLNKVRDQLAEGVYWKQRASTQPIAAELRAQRDMCERQERRKRQILGWWIAAFGERLTLSDVTPLLLRQLRKRLLDEGRTPATANRYTDILRHAFNVARREDRFPGDNPVERISRYKEERLPPRPYTPAEEQRLARELSPADFDMFRLAILTNIRRADQFALRKEHLNLEEAQLLIPRPKSRQARIVYLVPEAVAILQRQVARVNKLTPFVYPGRIRNTHRNPNRFYRLVFKPACERAGIPVEKGRKLWHSTRATFGTRGAEAGLGEHLLADAGGWLSTASVKHYVKVADERVKRAMMEISKHGQPEGNA